MGADTESTENPYSAPTEHGQRTGRSGIVRWVLLCVSAMLILLSFPVAWYTLELANQEYLRTWNPQRAIYDIEINGKPVSNGDVVRFGAVTLLVQWVISAALMVTAHFLRANSIPR